MKSPKTFAFVLLVLTSLGGAGLAWWQYQELADLRATGLDKDESAALKKRVAALERRNQELQDQLAAEKHDRAADQDRAATASTGGGPTDRGGFLGGRGGPGGGRAGFRGQGVGALRNVMANPEVQALIAVQQKARLATTYGSFFKTLNLTPAQQEQVESLLADRQSTWQDVLTAARDQGINPRTDPQAFQKLLADAQTSVNDSLKSVLGDAGFAQLQNYDQTMPERNVVNQLQQRLSYTDTPLTPAQSEQLVQILAANAPPPGTAGGAGQNPGGRGGLGARGGGLGGIAAAFAGGGPGFVGPTAAVTPAAVSQAQSVLASSQLAALQEIQQQQQAQQELRQVIGSALRGGNGGRGANAGAATNGATATGGG